MTPRHIMSNLFDNIYTKQGVNASAPESSGILLSKTRRHMMKSNNVENDNDDDYVYLKRPYLFNIRYNSKQVWDKLPEEEKTLYVNYKEYYEECRLIKLRSIEYPILTVVCLFIILIMVFYIIYMFTGFNIFSLFV